MNGCPEEYKKHCDYRERNCYCKHPNVGDVVSMLTGKECCPRIDNVVFASEYKDRKKYLDKMEDEDLEVTLAINSLISIKICDDMVGYYIEPALCEKERQFEELKELIVWRNECWLTHEWICMTRLPYNQKGENECFVSSIKAEKEIFGFFDNKE